MNEYYRIEARVNLDAICNNIDEVRRNINADTKIMAVIKADGYGHGAVALATALKDEVDAYGIAIIEEGIELRRAGFEKPILVLGFTPHQLYDELLKYDIIQTVFQYDMAKRLSDTAVSLGKQAKIHLKVDTGMTRIGFKDTDESIQIIKEISKLPNITIDGIYTHFASADEEDKTSARKQLSRFLIFADKLEKDYEREMFLLNKVFKLIDWGNN